MGNPPGAITPGIIILKGRGFGNSYSRLKVGDSRIRGYIY